MYGPLSNNKKLIVPSKSTAEEVSLMWFHLSVLERCPSYRKSNRASKERQGPTRGVRFTEVSVL